MTTDDLAFSAYLRMEGHPIIKSDQIANRSTFTFALSQAEAESLKVNFINSPFLSYYNEIRNLKKVLYDRR